MDRKPLTSVNQRPRKGCGDSEHRYETKPSGRLHGKLGSSIPWLAWGAKEPEPSDAGRVAKCHIAMWGVRLR